MDQTHDFLQVEATLCVDIGSIDMLNSMLYDGRQVHGAQQDCQRDIQRKHGARAQGGIRQVSSCLASPGADHLSDGWRR